ncbi:low temperature requirement protein A [Micromonospora sp. LOL_015]|uniref:low temperature requirement protein A n=1 Tax=Micromonospora sp. LOL_015 TaxID=3345416 RepID=UPI003A8B3469
MSRNRPVGPFPGAIVTAAGDPRGLLRGEQAPRRATFLELYFDLAFVVALALLLMTAALPAAFENCATIFVGAYLTIHLGRGLFFFALHDQMARQRAVRIWGWFAVSAVPWLAGVLVDETARVALWSVGLATPPFNRPLGCLHHCLATGQPYDLEKPFPTIGMPALAATG